MSPYVYRGNNHDANEPLPNHTTSTPGPKPKAFNPDNCGTYRGFKQHYRHNTPVCDPCKAANREYRKGIRITRPLKPCGTHAAYRRHLTEGTRICEPCNEANNAYNREHARLHIVPAESFDNTACGTYKGYRRHKRRGMQPCPPCLKANNDYHAQWRTRKAAA